MVRSVLEYACAVWHPGLSNKLSKDIERVQKRCLKVIYPKLSYSEALEESGLGRLDTRREDITQSTFKELKCPTHPLHYMLPPRKVSTSQMTLRPTYPFSAPKCNTRYGRDLIPYCITKSIRPACFMYCFHCYVILLTFISCTFQPMVALLTHTDMNHSKIFKTSCICKGSSVSSYLLHVLVLGSEIRFEMLNDIFRKLRNHGEGSWIQKLVVEKSKDCRTAL